MERGLRKKCGIIDSVMRNGELIDIIHIKIDGKWVEIPYLEYIKNKEQE